MMIPAHRPKPSFFEDQALELANHGLSIIPVLPDDKKPACDWKPYQSIRASNNQISDWFANEKRNIGVITGSISQIVVLDVDNPSELAKYPALPDTPKVRTGKGYHYYFKHPGFEVGNFQIKNLGDFRGDGGYVVAPPSLHPNGQQYKWLAEFAETPLAELPDWLLKLAKNHAKEKEPKPANDNAPSVATTAYGRAWFDDVRSLASASEGGRNNLLNTLAAKAGSLIAGGQLNQVEAVEALMEASKKNASWDDDRDEVRKTIMSGLGAGKRNPRYPSDPTTTVSEFNPKTGRLHIRSFADIKSEKVDWLWPGVLARGALSILAGNPGLGKSQVALSIGAKISCGANWPVTNDKAAVGNVIILSMEDRAEDTIKPRLEACGADVRRVHIITDVHEENGDRPFNMQNDLVLLEEAIEEIGSVSLVIIDPISAYLGKADTNNSGDVRGITTRLSALAQKFGLSILAVSHLNKSEGKQASHRVQGSISWIGAARTGFMIDQDGDDPQRRSMTPIKNNLASDQTGYAFKVLPKSLPDGIETSHVVWEDYSQNKTADQVLADSFDGGRAVRAAKDYLRAMLTKGPMRSSDVIEEGESQGIKRTALHLARGAIGIVIQQDPEDKRKSLWVLPEAF